MIINSPSLLFFTFLQTFVNIVINIVDALYIVLITVSTQFAVHHTNRKLNYVVAISKLYVIM